MKKEKKNGDLFSGLTKDEKHTQTPPFDDFYERTKYYKLTASRSNIISFPKIMTRMVFITAFSSDLYWPLERKEKNVSS